MVGDGAQEPVSSCQKLGGNSSGMQWCIIVKQERRTVFPERCWDAANSLARLILSLAVSVFT